MLKFMQLYDFNLSRIHSLVFFFSFWKNQHVEFTFCRSHHVEFGIGICYNSCNHMTSFPVEFIIYNYYIDCYFRYYYASLLSSYNLAFTSIYRWALHNIHYIKIKQFNYSTFRWVELDRGGRRSENRVFIAFSLCTINIPCKNVLILSCYLVPPFI